MPRERLYLFDTTLRNGAQTNGVDFTLADKLAIATLLDDLASTTSKRGIRAPIRPTEFFRPEAEAARESHRIWDDAPAGAFDVERSGFRALLEAEADAICFVAKSWDYHVRVALETTEEKTSLSIATACAPPRLGAAKCCWTVSIFLTATRPSPPMGSPAPRRLTMKARAGTCYATP